MIIRHYSAPKLASDILLSLTFGAAGNTLGISAVNGRGSLEERFALTLIVYHEFMNGNL